MCDRISALLLLTTARFSDKHAHNYTSAGSTKVRLRRRPPPSAGCLQCSRCRYRTAPPNTHQVTPRCVFWQLPDDSTSCPVCGTATSVSRASLAGSLTVKWPSLASINIEAPAGCTESLCSGHGPFSSIPGLSAGTTCFWACALVDSGRLFTAFAAARVGSNSRTKG